MPQMAKVQHAETAPTDKAGERVRDVGGALLEVELTSEPQRQPLAAELLGAKK